MAADANNDCVVCEGSTPFVNPQTNKCVSRCPDGKTPNNNNTCSECSEALSGENDSGYQGCQTKTVNGRTCQDWASQSPHAHSNNATQQPNTSLVNNYCRNPDGSDTIWCYTTDKETRRENCTPKGMTT